MSTVLEIEHLEVLRGRDEGGRDVWLIDAVCEDRGGSSRVIMSDHYNRAGAIVSALEWESQGFRVDWTGGRP